MTKIFKFACIAILFFSPITQALGPGSSGGGNGVGNAPIESYSFDPAQVPRAGSLYVNAFRVFGLYAPCDGSTMQQYFRSLAWYQVPQRFSELPENLTGLPFASDQAALQNFETHEIWIDQKAFKRMTVLGQATLLVHESYLSLFSSEVAFQKKHYDEAHAKAMIVTAEAYARKATAYIVDSKNQKKDRISYLEGLHALRTPAGLSDFWCSQVIQAKSAQGDEFSSECAEITDVNTHAKFKLLPTSAMYSATWEMKDPTDGKGHVCHIGDSEGGVSHSDDAQASEPRPVGP